MLTRDDRYFDNSDTGVGYGLAGLGSGGDARITAAATAAEVAHTAVSLLIVQLVVLLVLLPLCLMLLQLSQSLLLLVLHCAVSVPAEEAIVTVFT